MKKLILLLLALLPTLTNQARVDVDFSSHFDEGTTTISCASAWGWYSVFLQGVDVEDCDYLCLNYSASCNFNLVVQNESWQNQYQLTCESGAHEVVIPLTDVRKFSCVVIQNHAEGEITVNKACFCTEQEYLYPEPTDVGEARQNLSDTYKRYYEYSFTLTPGEDYGQYPQDLWDAFVQALDGALVLDDSEQNYGEDLSAEQLNALSHAIVRTYLALAAAKNTYLPADGYYRLVCARKFYNVSQDTGETTFYTKALYSKASGENGWKNLDATFSAIIFFHSILMDTLLNMTSQI